MFEEKASVSYQNEVEGTWGEFATPAGEVAFLLTKARLGTGATVKGGVIDQEWRLTSQLRPVREVLEIKTLDFGQLLQRDLDDHRVSTMLIPYLLEPRRTGPAFFPPILAALLPFNGNDPVDSYPEPTHSGPNEADGADFLDASYGAAFRVRRLATKGGHLHRIRLGRVGWNEELTKLVVIDGQHRAMALLAIDRTLNHSWNKGNGNRFRHFYEHRIEDLIRTAERDGHPITLERIEIPVLVCWFPELFGERGSAQKAARKLFVDVNKEARTPSEARLILLSDTELVNVFTRSLLNRLRELDPPMPLWAVEYDNPDKDAARPVRWSVVTNLNLLRTAVMRTVFGPKKYVRDVEQKIGRRESLTEKDEYMRGQLDVASLFTQTIEDGDRVVDRALIGNTYFPLSGMSALIERFRCTWGDAILTILGGLRPYEAHHRALTDLYNEWVGDDAVASLARDAMFEGVGMFWTLRDAHESWAAAPTAMVPDIVKAWRIIEDKAQEFAGRRTHRYLGRVTAEDLKNATNLYAAVNTHACQLGAILAFASVASRLALTHGDIAEYGRLFTAAWNASLTAPMPNGKDRRLVLGRGTKDSLNRIGKMDTPLAVYFRYFWLELLRTAEARAVLGDRVEPGKVDELAGRARRFYLSYLVDEVSKALKKSHPGWGMTRRRQRALETEGKALGAALKRWFGMDDATWQAWLASVSEAICSGGTAENGGEEAEPDGEESSASQGAEGEALAEGDASTTVHADDLEDE